MANLFFIHTPFQLFIAQQLINQEHLTQNYMIYGHFQGCQYFLEIYEMMKIPSMWNKCVFFRDLSSWAKFDFNDFSSKKKIVQSYHKICSVISSHNINRIFLGDINNPSYQLMAKLGCLKGLDVVFFEEGSSHYINTLRYGKHHLGGIVPLLKRIYVDLLVYKRLFGFKFAKWFYENLPYEEVDYTLRYSVRPIYEGVKERRLFPSLLLSAKLSEYLKAELRSVHQSINSILFMSEPVFEETLPNRLDLELEVIRNHFMSYDHKCNFVFIKFHPNENVFVRENISGVFDNLGIPHKILAESINIPIEYFLQYMRFYEIVCFGSSTMWYNRVLFQEQRFTTLLPAFYSLCKAQTDIESYLVEQHLLGLPKEYLI